VKILWARHGQNVANLSATFSCRVFDGDLTERGQRQAAEMAAPDLPTGAVATLQLDAGRSAAPVGLPALARRDRAVSSAAGSGVQEVSNAVDISVRTRRPAMAALSGGTAAAAR
jgi:hypothetical protein